MKTVNLIDSKTKNIKNREIFRPFYNSKISRQMVSYCLEVFAICNENRKIENFNLKLNYVWISLMVFGGKKIMYLRPVKEVLYNKTYFYAENRVNYQFHYVVIKNNTSLRVEKSILDYKLGVLLL